MSSDCVQEGPTRPNQPPPPSGFFFLVSRLNKFKECNASSQATAWFKKLQSSSSWWWLCQLRQSTGSRGEGEGGGGIQAKEIL